MIINFVIFTTEILYIINNLIIIIIINNFKYFIALGKLHRVILSFGWIIICLLCDINKFVAK